RAYALLNHKGDWKAAAKDLGQKGYGDPLPAGPKVTFGSKPGDKGQAPAEPAPWEKPVPLASEDTVPPFPSWCYPPAFGLGVEEGAAALDCRPDFIGVPMLPIGGAALGASRALAVTDTHLQTGRIFAGIIGRTGSAKTPGLNTVSAPVYERQSALLRDW